MISAGDTAVVFFDSDRQLTVQVLEVNCTKTDPPAGTAKFKYTTGVQSECNMLMLVPVHAQEI